MVVEPRNEQDPESGQSLMEFLLLLPMMIGLVIVLVRVNTAIQISIVNQQYARMHALWLAFNSSVYPALKMREASLTSSEHQDNQMVIGVSDNPAPEEGTYAPTAATSYIARKKGAPDSSDAEPSQRANVRIRDTVTLCTQINVIQSQGKFVPLLPMDPTGTQALGPYNLVEKPSFSYCRSGLQYVVDASDGGT